jgi:dipeptidyl aminopeptidase/acylaminoacyl peptidase
MAARLVPGRALALALGLLAALAGASAAPANRLTGADLFRLEWASDPEIRPDGRAVVYARRAYDVMTDRAHSSLWLVDVASGTQAPLVAGPGSYASPRWSPDGTRLAYVAAGEDGRAQLMVRWLASGTEARVADLVDAPEAVTWSADGRALAFLMFTPGEKPTLGQAPPKPEGAKWAAPLELITDVIYRADGEGYLKSGNTQLYVVSADGGAPRQLTSGAFDVDGPLSWAKDGSAIYASSNRHANHALDQLNSEVYRIAVADGTLTELTSREGPDQSPQVSPDGRRVAYLGFDDRLRSYENVRLYVMDADGGNSRVVSGGLDRSIDEARWAADGRSLYIRYVDNAVARIARIGLDGRLEPVASGLAGGQLDRPYSGGEFSVSTDGVVAFTSGSASRPADVAVVAGGKVRELTHLNADLLHDRVLGEVSALAVKSSFDQRPIDAWLMLPPAAEAGKRYPLILEIHGGPYASYGANFSTDDQLYAAAGYAVLFANPRGSTSYGETFANLIHHDYPSHDYDDLMSAVDAAIATGRVDPGQLFVTGGSGGGVLTAWIIGRTHRFAAAAVQKPVINWASWALTTDMYPVGTRYWFGKAPWEDPVAYWKYSPLSLVGEVTTPALVVVGDRDYRTPVSDAEQYYQALQLRGIPTALVKVPGASHGGIAARPSQSAAKASAILAWFERYRTQKEH